MSRNTWFLEPTLPDPTYANRTEGTWAWLRRSTVQRAIEARRFLNSNLAHLPPNYADSLYARLRHSWTSAFFELIVARTLQVIGGTVEIEPTTSGARRPDFEAKFPAGSVIVEATCPLFRADLQEDLGRKDKLVSIVEELTPPEWMVWVHELPSLGPSDSKKDFKRAVARLLEVGPPQGDQWLRVSGYVAGAVVDLTLIPKGKSTSTIAGGPAYSFSGDGIDSIRNAVRRKRQQVRGAGAPVILAIDASELISSPDDFDQALFGHERLYVDQNARPIRTKFIADGELNPHGRGAPTYAGVLAYLEAGFRCSHEPKLFLHPRFAGELPAEFSRFERRTLTKGNGIAVLPAAGGRVLQELNPVRA